MADKIKELNKKNRKLISDILTDNEIAHKISEDKICFAHGLKDVDECSQTKIIVTMDGGTVILEGEHPKEVPFEALEQVVLFANAMNNFYHYTTLAVSSDMKFYVRSIINTNRADLTVKDFMDALFDVEFMISVCKKAVESIISEDISAEEGVDLANEKIKAFFADDEDASDGESSEHLDNNNHEECKNDAYAVDLSNYFALCSALENDSAKELNSLLTEDIELAYFGEKNTFGGKNEVIKELRSCGFADDLHIARLRHGEKQDKGLTPFKKGEACIISGTASERICFITTDEASKLINGIYFDSSEGYDWMMLV